MTAMNRRRACGVLAAAVAAPAASPILGATMQDDGNMLTEQEVAQGWQRLFDGHSLDGWRASDAPGSFSVKDGAIVVRGPRSHLFYVGPVGNHHFTDFELRLEVKTFPKANSGVYFHTAWQETGWPAQGYEVQVNNSHDDPSRTGGLWGVADFKQVLVPDGRWFTLAIQVQGKRVTTLIDGQPAVDYTEEPNPPRKKGLEHRLLGGGTFALQGHDPASEVWYRRVRVRKAD
jgi:hypothetical protein